MNFVIGFHFRRQNISTFVGALGQNPWLIHRYNSFFFLFWSQHEYSLKCLMPFTWSWSWLNIYIHLLINKILFGQKERDNFAQCMIPSGVCKLFRPLQQQTHSIIQYILSQVSLFTLFSIETYEYRYSYTIRHWCTCFYICERVLQT